MLFLIPISNGNSAAPMVKAAQDKELIATDEIQAYTINSQAMVSLSFDDASLTVYDTAFPILESYNIDASFFFISSYLNAQWRNRLRTLQANGWEIGSHSRTHPHLENISYSQLISELRQSKLDLEAAGLAVSGFAYPYGSGSNNETIYRAVKEYYEYARTTTEGYNTPIIKQYSLMDQNQYAFTPIETLKAWIDEAILRKQWLIINMHTVDNSGDPYSISPEVLSELAEYIKAKVDSGEIQSVTLREGVTDYTETAWTPLTTVGHISQDFVITNGKILWFFSRQLADYIYDGSEWVENGIISYWEWHGDYHNASLVSEPTIRKISPLKITVDFKLVDSTNLDFEVGNTVTLFSHSPLAEVRITDIQGTANTLALAKFTSRRFSIVGGSQVTDGWLETGNRSYGTSDQNFYGFNLKTDHVKIISKLDPKTYSEYSDYAKGEYRSKEIIKSTDLPFTWCVGAVPFETNNLLSEAEDYILDGAINMYTGIDASPMTGITGAVLISEDQLLSIELPPIISGNYTLSVRVKGNQPDSEYSYQIDGGDLSHRRVPGIIFGYESIHLQVLSTQPHVITFFHRSGSVTIDYILLIPTYRSTISPTSYVFPMDIGCPQYNFLPLTSQNSSP